MLFSLPKIKSITLFLVLTSQVNGTVVMAQNLSFKNSAFSAQQISQASQLDLMYNQMNQSMSYAFQDIPAFANGLSQIQGVQNDEQLSTILNQLILLANNIGNNFVQAYQIGQQLSASLPANTPQANIVNQWSLLNGQGANTFIAWLNVLNPMQQAVQTQNEAQMENALSQMENAVTQTINLTNGLQTVTQETNNIMANYTNSYGNNGVYDGSGQMSMSEYEVLSQISSGMHNTTMSILDSIGGVNCNSWNYNYGTGNDEYHAC